MFGIICKDELAADNPSLFYNFRLGLQNYFDTQFKNVECVDDLDGIDILIIVDEHWSPHTDIWKKTPGFIDTLNRLNITTLVFNFEKIFNSRFPWNVDHQQKLQLIKNLHQFVSDVEDAAILNSPLLNKQLLSKDTILDFDDSEKQDKILFIGQSDESPDPSSAYSRRFNVISNLQAREDIPLDVCLTKRALSYKEFLTKLASYKFVLNPLGCGDFINVRFYEALKLGCIPIQQVTDNMLNKYSELSSNICCKFRSPDELQLSNIPDFNSFDRFNYYLEDYFKEVELEKQIA